MNLSEAMNGTRRGTTLQEYILQGSILDSSCEMLLHRLRGLCDNGDNPTETFEDKEYVYSISKDCPCIFFNRIFRKFCQLTFSLIYKGQPANGQTMNLRVRQDKNRKDLPCHLRYLGLILKRIF